MAKPKLLVCASGTKTGGGSGFEKLVEATQTNDANNQPILDAEIVGVVSNHREGGVQERAARLGLPFIYFPKPWTAHRYESIVRQTGAEWVALSGWLKFVEVRRVGGIWELLHLLRLNRGLDPRKTFNIHPGLLSDLGGRFGGDGMYGDFVHEAVAEAFAEGLVAESGPSMHFVTKTFDEGPAFFEHRISLKDGMGVKEIKEVVNAGEHEWQAKITNLVIHGKISWDGIESNTLRVPENYTKLPKQI